MPRTRNLAGGCDAKLTAYSNDAPQRSVAEEIANGLTHALGFILSIMGALLVARSASLLRLGTLFSCSVFLVTLVGLYALSTLSHLVKRSRMQDRLRAWDQGAVYLLIAGTYTPFAWAALVPPARQVGLAALWLAAGAGFFSKVVVRHRVNNMQTHSYILFGWIPAAFLFREVPASTLFWMAVGGLSYTLGTLFLKIDHRAPYLHALWHLFVVGGSACHFYAIYQFLIVPELAGQVIGARP